MVKHKPLEIHGRAKLEINSQICLTRRKRSLKSIGGIMKKWSLIQRMENLSARSHGSWFSFMLTALKLMSISSHFNNLPCTLMVQSNLVLSVSQWRKNYLMHSKSGLGQECSILMNWVMLMLSPKDSHHSIIQSHGLKIEDIKRAHRFSKLQTNAININFGGVMQRRMLEITMVKTGNPQLNIG